jgi:hypothetical protein
VFFGLEGGQTMRTLVADTLSAWRQAERVLAQSDPGSPDYEAARMAALELRDLYQRLTQQTGIDPDAAPSSEDADRDVLDRIRGDLETETTNR